MAQQPGSGYNAAGQWAGYSQDPYAQYDQYSQYYQQQGQQQDPQQYQQAQQYPDYSQQYPDYSQQQKAYPDYSQQYQDPQQAYQQEAYPSHMPQSDPYQQAQPYGQPAPYGYRDYRPRRPAYGANPMPPRPYGRHDYRARPMGRYPPSYHQRPPFSGGFVPYGQRSRSPPPREQDVVARIPVRTIYEAANKAQPSYDEPTHIGGFSLDERRRYRHDRSQLPTYTEPQLGANLKDGYQDQFVKRDEGHVEDIDFLLTWLVRDAYARRTAKGEDVEGQAATEAAADTAAAPAADEEAKETDSKGDEGDADGEKAVATDAAPASTAADGTASSDPSKLTLQEVCRGVNFISWRGLLTKMMVYLKDINCRSKTFVAAKVGNTIFLNEYESPSARTRRLTQTPSHELSCYSGFRFESYATIPSASVGDQAAQGEEAGPDYGACGETAHELSSETVSDEQIASAVVNTHTGYWSVFETTLDARFRILAAGEVDATDPVTGELLELKTVIDMATAKPTHKKFRLMKWWAQSHLAGIKRLVAGYRDNDHTLARMETLDVEGIPAHCAEGNEERPFWFPAQCFQALVHAFDVLERKATPEEFLLVKFDDTRPSSIRIARSKDPRYAFLPQWFAEMFDIKDHIAVRRPKPTPTTAPTATGVDQTAA
eukprot:m.356637 g.356637  ORF g.356637 m.356637 type:complete len:656 (-) comp17594_c0_seq1:2610-4577(-)